jgi:hypothetical protein
MLTHMGQYLDGIPGRKNLFWVAGRFDIALFPREEDPVDLQEKIKAEINALAQAQVAVFTIDVRGVVINPEGALTGGRPNGGAANMSDPNAQNSPDPNSMSNPTGNPVLAGMRVAGQGSSLNRSYATEETIASMTGGRAFYSDNGIAELLAEATEDGGNYYTLTYSPPSAADDGKCHNIAVKLTKTEYQVSYRKNYCHTPVVSAPREEAGNQETLSIPLVFPLQAGDVLQGNMRPGAPMLHDLIFSAHLRTDSAITTATPDQMMQLSEQSAFYLTHRKNRPAKPPAPVKIQNYAVDYRVLDPQFKAQAARTGKPPVLEFAIAAFDRDGKVLNGVVNDAMLESSTDSGKNKSGLYRVHQTLMVPTNAVSIRVGVRDRTSERMGTLEVPLPLKPEDTAHASLDQH